MNLKNRCTRMLFFSLFSLLVPSLAFFGSICGQEPIAKPDLVFQEKDGLVAVEAEHFFKQTSADVRAFHLTHSKLTPSINPDGDPNHVAGASGGAYLEILPDTRRTHDDKLTKGVNFSPTAGAMTVLHYKVNISKPGKYYVWVRAYSTGSEDNGLHVGIDGKWPASGQRLQWCAGKQSWRWESKQRTEKEHCGEPYKIFLDIKKAGEHVIHFSMREDGFEFDKWLMTTKRNFARPNGIGPAPVVAAGKIPAAFPFVKPTAAKPTAKPKAPPSPIAETVSKELQMPASMFMEGKTSGVYFDQKKWVAINPETHKNGIAERTFPYPTGIYNVKLKSVGENDGKSSYKVSIDGELAGTFTNPLSDQTYEEDAKFHKTWQNVQITEGAIIKVESTIGSEDGKEFSRARWSGVSFAARDDETAKAIAPLLRKAARLAANQKTNPKNVNRDRKTSPTKPSSDQVLQLPRGENGDGSVKISGELKQWHKVTLDLSGPYAHEKDNVPNPFTDHRFTVKFRHTDGTEFNVPGFFAADGNASNSSAESGTVWRAHFAANKIGKWNYTIAFRNGKLAALNSNVKTSSFEPFDGQTGSFEIAASDKTGRDLRAHGQLKYVGKRYLQFAGSGKYFLKVGADAPETLLAYSDFDNTLAGNAKKAPIKSWSPHLQDWKDGDPTWKEGQGKGLIGAVNYLSGKGCNAFSFLTYNAGGDGDNVWPFIQREDKLHYDCSKLEQWGTVFDHATARGMYLHFKLQETENDDHKKGKGNSFVPESLDGGNLGAQRKLYCREMIARFGHNLALNWNLGEENTQTTKQQIAMVNYLSELDPYDHNIVIHTFPDQQDRVYRPLLGKTSRLTGVSLQNSSLSTTHAQTVKWVSESEAAGKPWVVAFDESGSAAHAQCPDTGYKGFDGRDRTGKMVYTLHKVRKETLWGTLMAGGAGNEYYFGYQFAENDIVCEDWRSRDKSWDYCRIAIEFFHENQIPFWEMKNADSLVGNPEYKAGKFCFAKQGDLYLVYIPNGDATKLNLGDTAGEYDVKWFNPRTGGKLRAGSIDKVTAGNQVDLGVPPTEEDALKKEADRKKISEENDWVAVIRKK